MKKSLLVAAIVTITAAAGAFAGPGPSYQGQSASRNLPGAAPANSKCEYMLMQTASGKTPATGASCTAASVKASALCRAHCG
jgi:hypothetical protein